MKIVLFKIIRFLIFAVGVTVTINGLVLSFTTSFNIGIVLTLLLGIGMLGYSLLFKFVNTKFPKWLKYIICIGFSVVIAFVSFLLIYGTNNTTSYSEDAIIVLGAGLRGDKPSLLLAERLNIAIEYHNQNPESIIIVSGGQGPQEMVSEAVAMEEYLISKGVSNDVIIKEDKSTSTYENFAYSKEILCKEFGDDFKVAFVSNEYHIYRAQGISKTAGITNTTHIHSTTRWYSIVPGTLRECLAVLKFWITKK